MTQNNDSQSGGSVSTAGGNYTDSDMKAAASLEIAVKYKVNCGGQKDCDLVKPNYDFKVFVFDKKGNQVRVIRSGDKGIFKTAMPEGDYILLVAKAIEGEGLSQEHVSLKNGKTLKLDLNYGMEAR